VQKEAETTTKFASIDTVALPLLHCVAAVCCSVYLQCVTVCCSVLQCVAVCCSVLQCVVACCSARGGRHYYTICYDRHTCNVLLQCVVAVRCCSVLLQYVATVCCSVL